MFVKIWEKLNSIEIWERLDPLVDWTKIRVLYDVLPHYASEGADLLDVPGYKQTQSYTCGFVAGLMVLRTFYPDADTEDFYNCVRPNPTSGTSNTRLISALRQNGIGVSVRNNLGFDQIRKTIDAGFPIITLVKTNDIDTLHWVVTYGYGLKSGNRPNRIFVSGNSFFKSREIPWSKYARLISPKGFGLVCWGK